MRRTFCLLLLVLSGPVAVADTITIQGPSTPLSVGDVFSVGIDVSDINDLYAFQFDLNFDPTLFSAQSVNEGPLLPSGGPTFFIPGTVDNVGGMISATADSLISAVPGISGSGILVQLQFTALAPGVSSLSFANEILLDSSLNDITSSTTFQDGLVTVGGTSPVPEPNSFTLVALGTFLMGVSPFGRRIIFATSASRA